MSAPKWNPPSHGTPCWINILATNPKRAKVFYETVFGWKMRDGEEGVDMAHFNTPDAGCPDGGITKVSEADFIKTKGNGGTILYLSVDDLEACAEQIVQAGGKQMSEVLPEGKFARMQHFEDTEGNFFGIHEWMGERAS